MMLIALIFVAFSFVLAEEEIAAPPSVECTEQNCIVSKLDMENLDILSNMIKLASNDTSGVLALKFESNEIWRFPDQVFKLFPNLLCVMVEAPGIRKIDGDDFIGGSNLQFLYLPGNRIKLIPSSSFIKTIHLNEINLENNEITYIAPEAFNSLEYLEILNLSGNRLEANLAADIFKPLVSLMNLDLSNNNLRHIKAEHFMYNRKLNSLDLSNNKIVSMTNNFLELLPQIKILNVMNNHCTSKTILETIPYIKITNATEDGDDEDSPLQRCYQNYLDITTPQKRMDVIDLLDQAEISREDIEEEVIAELNNQLREKDREIYELKQDDMNDFTILCCVLFVVFSFAGIGRLVTWVVDNTHNVDKKIAEKKTKAVEKVTKTEIDPKPAVYVIEL